MSEGETFFVEFQPLGKQGSCRGEQSLLESARQLGIDIVSICGGRGACGQCKLQILDGMVSPPTHDEIEALHSQELEEGYRLACQTYPRSDCKLRVPPESLSAPQRLHVEGLDVSASLEPPVRCYSVQLAPPSGVDMRADAERLLEALERQCQLPRCTIDVEVLQELSPYLRSLNWKAHATVRNNEVIALGSREKCLGLAIDLGTSKVAGYLVDLDSGQTLAAKGIMNPQISYGEDVISRITYAMEPSSGREKLQELVVQAINHLADALCAEVNATPKEIVEATVVGNTAMHHLLLHLPVSQLALSPFLPTIQGALDIKARDLGLSFASGAYVHFLPNIAAFVGGDHVAMLIATQHWWSSGTVIVLDIGTNTEVSLVSDGEIFTVSCASGPAFEGAHILNGMRAVNGAIERLRLVGGQVEYQTVGHEAPLGICGSGIMDAVAQLRLAGIVDQRGKLGEHPRVRSRDGRREFVLVSRDEGNGAQDIVITQEDIREVQLAKGAIRTGIQLLLAATGHTEDEVDRIVIAGVFGNYMDVASAVTIRLLSPLPLGCFQQVGNAAGMGAKLALISESRRAEAQSIAEKVHYIELATNPRFAETFAQAIYIG